MSAVKYNDKYAYRHEYKYLIDAMQQSLLKLHAAGTLQPDAHADENGEYLIRSLYFDSLDDKCFYENENGDDPREKYRIRFYNCDSSRISLECKAKTRNMTRKTSCPIKLHGGDDTGAGKRCVTEAGSDVLSDAAPKFETGGYRSVCENTIHKQDGQCTGYL